MAGVVDNNAAILHDVFNTHDAMIAVMDRIVADVCSGYGPKRLEDGTIDYGHYLNLYQEQKAEEEAAAAEEEEVAPEAEEEVPSEQPLEPAEREHTGIYPEGAIVFGGDHGQATEG